jgi:indole-3-glycerol phosphate synthase
MSASMAADILDRIVQAKRDEVTASRREIPETRMREAAEARQDFRPFAPALESPGPAGINIIAEVKRASPSRGVIRHDLDAARLAAAYTAGGAAAISVLTESSFFLGSADDVMQARRVSPLPILRKDFIFCDYQMYESAAMGADAVLLIVRILSQTQLADLLQLAAALGLDALVEVYSEADIQAANRAGAGLIGVNNRNLKSFATDIAHTLRLLPLLSPDQVVVAASGVRNREDIRRYRDSRVFNFLIGESLVRSETPAEFLSYLRGVDA